MANQDNNNFIIEYYKIGNFVKVSAIDPVTLKETSIVGASNVSKHELAQLAAKKLRYILSKTAQ